MYQVASIEQEPGKPYLRRVTMIDAKTGEVAGVLHYGDSVSDRAIRLNAPGVFRQKRRGTN